MTIDLHIIYHMTQSTYHMTIDLHTPRHMLKHRLYHNTFESETFIGFSCKHESYNVKQEFVEWFLILKFYLIFDRMANQFTYNFTCRCIGALKFYSFKNSLEGIFALHSNISPSRIFRYTVCMPKIFFIREIILVLKIQTMNAS